MMKAHVAIAGNTALVCASAAGADGLYVGGVGHD